MDNKSIALALQSLTPGAQWSLMGDTVDGLTWLDQVQTQPTLDQINAAILAYIDPTIQATLDAKNTSLAADVRLNALLTVLGL
jgi:hypothetical protein